MRHSKRLSYTGGKAMGRESGSVLRVSVAGRSGLASVITKALVRLWMALKFSVLRRRLRRRMPINVADISEARCTLLTSRYLSTTAFKVPMFSLAAVAKVKRAWLRAAMRTLTLMAHTGSSPVFNICAAGELLPEPAPASASASGPVRSWPSGWLALRFRPCQWRRSVSTCTLVSTVLEACAVAPRLAMETPSTNAKKCAMSRPRSCSKRGRRSNTKALDEARHSALTKKLENAGCASSAR